MEVVNAYILFHEIRNENQRNNCCLVFSCRRLERDLMRKVQHLPKMFHKQHQASDSWEGTLLIEYPLLARRHILRECVKFVQRYLRILLEKEKEKRLCGGVLLVKCHSVCQSASNCTTQSENICKYRKYVLHRFFFL